MRLQAAMLAGCYDIVVVTQQKQPLWAPLSGSRHFPQPIASGTLGGGASYRSRLRTRSNEMPSV